MQNIKNNGIVAHIYYFSGFYSQTNDNDGLTFSKKIFRFKKDRLNFECVWKIESNEFFIEIFFYQKIS